MPETSSDKMDLTPTPRLLQVLDHVAIEAWQCVAEIIDNSLDSLAANNVAQGQVLIEFDPKTKVLKIQDNGSGMTFDALEKALRAGYSSKKRTSELGLFGIGFNIAIARLGNRTTVATKTSDDKDWLEVVVDIGAMVQAGSYEVTPKRTNRETKFETGTIVSIELDRENLAQFERRQFRKKLGERIGQTYSYILRSAVPGLSGEAAGNPRDVQILIDDQPIKPWLPCIWSEHRSVKYKGSDVNAVRYFDVELQDGTVCHACGNWQSASQSSSCNACGSYKVEVTSRRVCGWLGVQRHMHTLDFGISFLRNGREIIRQDKSIFTFQDPDTGQSFKDYPVEWPADQGRIVGEVHCDHVPVDFTKSTFKKEHPLWKGVVEIVRGDTSLQPKRAKGANSSPLSDIFNAYRINEPGTRYLIPGNGERAIHEATKNWAEKFYEGDPDYETDERWYKAAESHDIGKLSASPGGSPTGRPPTISPLSPTKPSVTSPTPKAKPSTRELSDSERMELWRKGGYQREDLTKTVNIPTVEKSFDLAVWETITPIKLKSGVEVCAIAIPTSGRTVHGFVNKTHRLLTDYGRNATDLALFEIATSIRNLENQGVPVSAVFDDLMNAYPDEQRSETVLRNRISEMERRIRTRVSALTSEAPDVFWSALSGSTQEEAENNKIATEPSLVWSDAIKTGQYAEFLTLSGIAEIVDKRPEQVFDGKLFKQHYASHHADLARKRSKSYVLRAINDLVAVKILSTSLNTFETRQAENALHFLEDNLA